MNIDAGPMRRESIALSFILLLAPVAARGEEAKEAPLPAAVGEALGRIIEAQRAGDLVKYAAAMAAPVGPVFREHVDSVTKVGEAKRQIVAAMAAKFGAGAATAADPFPFAADETRLRDSLKQLLDMHIDAYAPSGDQYKLNVTTTIALPDGSKRTIPQGFLAIQQNGEWRVQDMAKVGHLADLKTGAKTNWEIFRQFSRIAADVDAGKYASRDAVLAAVQETHDRLTNANAAPLPGQGVYSEGVRHFEAGEFEKSLALFKQSAELNYPHAASMVAIQYSEGLGVKEDQPQAVEWFRKDLLHNDPVAQNHLGSILLEGEGVPQNTAEGLRLLKLSADQDFPAAFLNIGRAYLFGLGVPKNNVEGMSWYVKAAELGNDQAAYFVKWLATSPGNRSFRNEKQVQAFQQIMMLRGAAMSVEVGGTGLDGYYHPGNSQRAAEMRAEADRLARENGLE